MVQSIDERRAARVPPHNVEVEESLLGAMMLSRDAVLTAIEQHVDPSDFYKPAHGHICAAIYALNAAGEPVDPVTVAEELRRRELLDAIGGRAVLLRLQSETPASSNASHYSKIIAEHALLRRLIAVAGEISEMGYEVGSDAREAVDRAESLVFEVAQRQISDSMVDLYGVLERTLEDLERLFNRDSRLTGVASGYNELDDVLLGLQPNALIICAARPGQGKTSFALGAAKHVAVVEKKPVLFFSMEMGQMELTKRLLSAEAKVPARNIATGDLSDVEWPRLQHAVGRLASAPFFIDDNPHTTIMEMRAKARRLKARHGSVGLIVIDYLQLMSSGRRVESRQVEVSELSRGLKILARELECPVLALSQLNRQLEYRTDKRPMLADLRESGCLTASTRVLRADTNAEVTLGELVASGERNIPVWTLDEHLKLVPGTMTHAFASGVKEAFALRFTSGRMVEASANHPFLTVDGWKAVEHLAVGDRLATAREIPDPAVPGAWDRDELLLLGHLIGDGCTLARHAIQYTTTDRSNASAVAQAALRRFGIEARVVEERRWIQVHCPSPDRLTHGRRNPIAAWLDDLDVFDLRSGEKRIPARLLTASRSDIALFLHHLWATDGSITRARSGAARVSYATTSRDLAIGVQSLLLRLGIRARVRATAPGRGRPGFSVDVTGATNQLAFLTGVGCHGRRGEIIPDLVEALEQVRPNPNADTVPREIWNYVRGKLMPQLSVTGRELATRLGTQYCGSTLYKPAMSRQRMARLAAALPDGYLEDLATSDVFWDEIAAIEPLGPQEVFDATVPGTHNFVANGIVAHNSIEQDADVVLFIYRDDYYNPDSEARGTAEVIVAKHRAGPTATARLAFVDKYTLFANMARGE